MEADVGATLLDCNGGLALLVLPIPGLKVFVGSSSW